MTDAKKIAKIGEHLKAALMALGCQDYAGM